MRIGHLRDVDVFVTDRLDPAPLRELCRSEGIKVVETGTLIEHAAYSQSET